MSNRIHREVLNKHKLTMLKKAAEVVTDSNKNIVDISIFRNDINMYNNWQKIRYHGLITHVTENGVKQRGKWLITRNGWSFLRGDMKLPKWVDIQENSIVGRSDQHIGIQDVYRGSEAITNTFEYFDDYGQPTGFKPTITSPPQLSLI